MAGCELVHAVAAGDLGREARADRAVDVPDIVGELHLLAVLEHRPRVLDHAGVERVGDRVAPADRADAAVRAGVDLGQQRVEVEIVEVGVAAADLAQQVGAADGLLQRAQAQRGQDLAHLLGDEAHQVDDLLGRAGEALAQVGALGADADRAGVGVALADQDAAHGDQRQGADAVLLGTEQGGDDDVAAGLDAAVGAQGDAVAQPVQGEDLVDLGQAHLPGRAGIFDRGLRRGAGAADMAGDQDHVGLGLGDAGGDGADAGLGDQLHADPGVGVDLLQVVDELGQVLDRVDVVVRRRRDQGDAGRGVAQAGDLERDLEARQLAALAGLGTLGDLDLELLGGVEIFGGDAEAARGHLLDRRVGVVAVGARVEALLALAALAAVGPRADPVHGDGQGLVRLGREGAQRHAGRDEALPDLGDALDLVERHRRQLAVEVEQVADRDRVLRLQHRRVLLEGVVAVAGDRVLELVDHLGFERVGLAAAAVAVEAADGQRRLGGGEGTPVQRRAPSS